MNVLLCFLNGPLLRSVTKNPLCLETGHSKVETFRKIKKQIQLPSFETFFVFFQQLQIVICMNFLEVALNWIMHWLAMLEPRVINAHQLELF